MVSPNLCNNLPFYTGAVQSLNHFKTLLKPICSCLLSGLVEQNTVVFMQLQFYFLVLFEFLFIFIVNLVSVFIQCIFYITCTALWSVEVVSKCGI